MNLDLLTIANRASLGRKIVSSIDNTKNRIEKIKAIVDKIGDNECFNKEEVTQELEFSIIGLISILEQHLNNLLYHIYVSFPSKIGGKKFEISDLGDKGSLLELFYDKATQRILDLAYGRFERFIDSFLVAYDINTKIDVNVVEEINEIKCTRDCLIHSNGKANALYFTKTGTKARARLKDEKLKIDIEYFNASVDKILSLIKQIETLIPNKYKESTRAYVFKQMWDATCLSRRITFERAWKIENPDMVRPIDIENNFGFSTSEMEVYNLFRYLYAGSSEYKVDFALFFERWDPSSNEYQIAVSWLNNQFYF